MRNLLNALQNKKVYVWWNFSVKCFLILQLFKKRFKKFAYLWEKTKTQMSSNTTQTQPITKRAVKFQTRISQTHFHTPLYISISLSPGCSRVWQVWKTAMSRSILLSQIFTGTPRTIFELVERIIIHNIEMKNWHFTHHIKYLVYIKYISTLINMKKKKEITQHLYFRVY